MQQQQDRNARRLHQKLKLDLKQKRKRDEADEFTKIFKQNNETLSDTISKTN